jgi:PAS domain S-box-containing protein
MEVNEAAVRLYGSDSKEKLIGRSAFEFIAEKDRVRVMEVLKSALEDGQIRRNVEITFLTEDGREYFAEVSSALLKDVSGNPVGFIAITRDITERKRAEEALRESERRYRLLAENAEDVIWTVDMNMRPTYISPSITHLLGYSVEEAMAKPMEAVYVPASFETAMKVLTEELATENMEQKDLSRSRTLELELNRKDGSIVPVEVKFSFIREPDGRPANILAIARDITERKQAEEVLRESEERFRDLLENANNLIQSVTPDGHFLYVNKAWRKILGYSEKEIVNLTLWDIIHPDSISHCKEVFQRVLSGETVSNVEAVFVAKDGKLVPVEGNVNCRFEGGKPVSTRGIFRDIIERKRAEEKAREVETLKEVDRMRSELLVNVSHELRTPLTSIKGFATTLLRSDVKWSEEDQRDFLQSIDQETERLIRLINDLLDMSRIEAGGLKLEKDNYHIADILNSVNSRLASLTEHHQLQVIVPSELPPVFVDEMRIGQVLSNLVENAAKFSGEGTKITIEAQLAGDNINISVTDRGQGIPAELLDKVFDRFYQAESIVTGRKSGTGLGLSICRGILEGHGGKIWVESKVGKGSKFSFNLPVSKGGEETA